MEKNIEFEAVITSIKKLPKPKAGKNVVIPKKGELFAIELNQTHFRFEDGGQLEDVGAIENIPIFRVLENEKTKTTEHHLFIEGEWEVGKKVQCFVDGAVRFDYMQNHSSQHLITAIADNVFGYKTVSWHMTQVGPSSIDLVKASSVLSSTPSSPPAQSSVSSSTLLSAEETSDSDFSKLLDKLEKCVNDKIIENAPIFIHSLTYDEYKHPENLSYELRSSGIPEGVSIVRIVEIKGIDANTCCGTHVQSLGQLQMIKFVKVEIPKADTYRLYYLCGGRLSSTFSSMLTREKALTRVLSVAASDIEKATVQWIESEGSERKQRKKLEEELAQVLAEEIVSRIRRKGKGEGEEEEEEKHDVLKAFHYHRNELSGTLLTCLNSTILALLPTAHVIVTYTQPGSPPLLYSVPSATTNNATAVSSAAPSSSSSSPSSSSSSSSSSSFSSSSSLSPTPSFPLPPYTNIPVSSIVGKNPVAGNFAFIAAPTPAGIAWVKEAGPKFGALLKGKGGGKDNKYSGKIEDLRELKNIGSLLV